MLYNYDNFDCYQPTELFLLLNRVVKDVKITDYIEKDIISNFLEKFSSQRYSDIISGDRYSDWDISESFMLNLAKEIDYAIKMTCKDKGIEFSTFAKSEQFKIAYNLFFRFITEIVSKNNW